MKALALLVLTALSSVASLMALLVCPAAHAQEPARDPTAWPPALRAALAASQPAASASGAAGGEAADRSVRQVILSGGQAYVVQRGRRFAVGEQLDGARIERITELAVWLRDPSGQVRREPLYGGVEKRVPAAAASSVKNSKEKP